MGKLLVAEVVRRNCQRKVYLTLLALGWMCCWLVFPLQAATPKLSEPIRLKANRSTNQPITWAEIWKKLFEHPRAIGGGRGEGEISACAPNRNVDNVDLWNKKPLFVWHGNVREISVSLVGSKEKSILWQHQISEAEAKAQMIIYDGPPLQPGAKYEWELSNDNKLATTAYFQTIPAKQSSAIAQDLNKLETALKASGASAEDLALQRAKYFADRQLWLDILPEVFSVKNPSPALKKISRELPTELCEPRIALS